VVEGVAQRCTFDSMLVGDVQEGGERGIGEARNRLDLAVRVGRRVPAHRDYTL
jgi:hypothetical protein